MPTVEVPLKIREIDHVVLSCRDQSRMIDFYTRVLGLSEERRIEAIGLIQLRAGASLIDLVPATEARSESARNVDHFCLGVEIANMNEAVGYLRANAIEIIGEPAMRYGARGMGLSIYIRDPEGNVVELKQMPHGRPA
ncbi:MAG: glyoxylase family protein [Candidatus Binataceae bacterium]|jgi:glyoxylase I family protein|nr:glyoxylase family protein [Candidatus Binataceae bacterium]